MKSEGQSFRGTDNLLLRFPPAAVTASLSEVARYAGGSRYRPDEKMRKVIAESLSLASRLIQPGAVYRLHRIGGLEEEGRGILTGPLQAGLPVGVILSEKSLLGAVVITLGAALEEEVKALNERREVVRALYLDAAGSALLQGLDALMEAELKREADKRGLNLACRQGPGLNLLPLELQRDLFRLVDPAPLGVALNEQMVIRPAKSVSFFIFFSDSPRRREKYDCASCQREDCLYRK
ncbi:MAG: hypothetical protein QMD32_00425 [Smithellaceae bacterium]|nr:hypothetical protein [Smithellaceae bacterium]